MGAKLVGAALSTHWAGLLTERERLILLFMAHTAHDSDRGPAKPARLYWGGWDAIMLAVFGELEPGTAPYRTAKLKIKAAVARLIATGAITRLEGGFGGQRAVYRIDLSTTQAALFDLNPARPERNTA